MPRRPGSRLVISLAHAYDGRDPQELQLASWDNHPNAFGHRLMAEALYQELRTRPDLMGVPATDMPAVARPAADQSTH